MGRDLLRMRLTPRGNYRPEVGGKVDLEKVASRNARRNLGVRVMRIVDLGTDEQREKLDEALSEIENMPGHIAKHSGEDSV